MVLEEKCTCARKMKNERVKEIFFGSRHIFLTVAFTQILVGEVTASTEKNEMGIASLQLLKVIYKPKNKRYWRKKKFMYSKVKFFFFFAAR